MRRIKLILIFFLSLVVLILLQIKPEQKITLQEYASHIVEICKSTNYSPNCYDKEIPKLMDQGLTMNEAFEVTRKIQAIDPSYAYCHELAHDLSAKQVQKDPDNWENLLAQCPKGLCANGCLHGGFQEKFRKFKGTDEQIEEVIPTLKNICEPKGNWQPTNLEKANCYHGLGHLSVYITNANIKKAVDLCQKITSDTTQRGFAHLCYEGLYMQVFQPIEPEDEALVKDITPTKDNLRKFCKEAKNEEAVEACWQEGWPLAREMNDEPEKLIKYCNVSINDYYKTRCFQMLFHVVGQSKNFKEDEIIDYCNQIKDRDTKILCFANTAISILDAEYKFIPNALNLCKRIEDKEISDICFKTIGKYSGYNFIKGSSEYNHLCQSLKETTGQELCGGLQ